MPEVSGKDTGSKSASLLQRVMVTWRRNTYAGCRCGQTGVCLYPSGSDDRPEARCILLYHSKLSNLLSSMLKDLHLLQQQFYFSIICLEERTQASGNHVSTWWHLLKLADGQPSFSQEKQWDSHPHSSLPLPPPLSFSLDENKMWLFSLVIDVLSHSLKQCRLSKKDSVSSSLFLALIKYILVDIFSKLNSEQEDLVYFPLV